VETDDIGLGIDTLEGLGLLPARQPGGLTADLGDRRAEDLCRALVVAGVGVRGFQVERPSLEETFVALTGEGFDVAQ
jgi:ABC-2 type transport system ATP-binding protein